MRRPRPASMRDHLVFYVNGRRHEVRGEATLRSLSDWLRSDCGLVGTKVVCAEGDCGACSVLLGRFDLSTGRIVYRTVDACIAFLYQLDGAHVVTVEGLKRHGALSVVQQAMIDCHGSQCGFCTPGFVVALHGLVEQSRDRGSPALDDEGLRYGLSGNLCRCTGYAQILEAGRTIDPASVTPIAALYDASELVSDIAGLSAESVAVPSATGEPIALVPTTIDEALALRAKHPNAKIVAGATDVGVQRNHGKIDPRSVLWLGRVEGFDRVEALPVGVLALGAGATWRQVELAALEHLPEWWEVLSRFGSPQIRELGTVGGNLANGSPIADALPTLYALGADVIVASTRGERRAPIDRFYLGYKKLDLAADELIVRVEIPLLASDERLRIDKVSKRRDMDISTVTSALWWRLAPGGETIAAARFAFGGVGPTVVRCRRAEASVVGQPASEALFRAAGRVARTEVTPISDVRGDASYRLQLVENLFLKAWHEAAPQPVGV
ncbi:MAG: xanthine dehydrogenase small subunit [Lacipirellulaceae bacterium]